MARISTIQGIQPMDPTEAKQRSRRVPRQGRLNLRKWDQAELKVYLVMDQMNILSSFYPEVDDYKKGVDFLRYTLSKGLDKANTFGLPNDMRYLYGVVENARRLAPTIAGVGEFVPDKCAKILEALNSMPIGHPHRVDVKRSYEQCVNLNGYADMLNKHLEGSAHHLLYEFIQPQHMTGVVAAKSVAHRNAVSALADIAGVDRTNLRQWFRNGVMRENAHKGLEPFSPERTIEILKTEVPAQAGIGGPFLAALIPILEIVIAAIGLIGSMIALLKKPEQIRFEAAAQGIGNETFGPEQSDWLPAGIPPGATPGENSISNIVTPLILGGAALLILN